VDAGVQREKRDDNEVGDVLAGVPREPVLVRRFDRRAGFGRGAIPYVGSFDTLAK
jgi:hypothetical protein